VENFGDFFKKFSKNMKFVIEDSFVKYFSQNGEHLSPKKSLCKVPSFLK